jgi:hypothetical protein
LKFCFDVRVALIRERALALLGARIHIGFIEVGIQGPDQAIQRVMQVHVRLKEIGRCGSQAGMLGCGGNFGLCIGISRYGECQQSADYGSNRYHVKHMNLP